MLTIGGPSHIARSVPHHCVRAATSRCPGIVRSIGPEAVSNELGGGYALLDGF